MRMNLYQGTVSALYQGTKKSRGLSQGFNENKAMLGNQLKLKVI